MHVSAKVDYAVRALLLLAARAPALVTVETLSSEQDLPRDYAEGILNDLRKHGYVVSKRGAGGGYSLARAASSIPVGEVVAALEGPFVTVRAAPVSSLAYEGVAQHVPALWDTVDARLHSVLDEVSLDDLLAGRIPA